MCTEDVNNDSLYTIRVNKLHESLTWYTQYLKISSITLLSDAWLFTKDALCFYLFFTIYNHLTKIFHNQVFHKTMQEYGLTVCFSRYILNHRNMWAGRDLQGFNLLFRVILSRAGCSRPHPASCCYSLYKQPAPVSDHLHSNMLFKK